MTHPSSPRRPASRSRRRGTLGWVLVVAFVVVPLLEIFALIQVGQVIGPWWTIGLLVLDSLVGAWLVRREGGRAWSALRTALTSGRMPAEEIADGALILIGGTLLLAPGFVTDLAGLALIVPLTRPFARRLLASAVRSRLVVAGPGTAPGFGVGFGVGPRPGADPSASAHTHRPRPDPGGTVVEGEVVD